jgi:hypothetical protein
VAEERQKGSNYFRAELDIEIFIVSIIIIQSKQQETINGIS